jgi:hypothetical protein
MLSFEDKRWEVLEADCRVPIDLRPLLRRLESGEDPAAWDDICQELYHQGDVGDGSFVAIPHLVRIHRKRGVVDLHTYAVAAAVELARDNGSNPDVPSWAREGYDSAPRDFASLGLGVAAGT